jgi:hypothetical protein
VRLVDDAVQDRRYGLRMLRRSTGATALTIGVATIAGFPPASPASRVDPMVAIRCE